MTKLQAVARSNPLWLKPEKIAKHTESEMCGMLVSSTSLELIHQGESLD